MRILKIIGWLLLALIAILAVLTIYFKVSLSPDYEGSKDLIGLTNAVNVHYDTYGIPHIYAEDEVDAMRTLGYVHAQDRLWQMELLRRIGSGGLSEVFGADLIPTDKMFLSLGIDDNTDELISKLDMHSPPVIMANAYLDGINQFIAEGPTPVEYYLTGLDKTEFQLKDVYNTIGYMAFSFAMAQKTDPLLTNIKDKLGVAYLQDLAIDADTTTVLLKNHPGTPYTTISNSITAMATKALDKLPVPQLEGSNSWVIGPEKTKNGKVIFANDPHIGFAQPSVWYEVHVVASNFEIYGYHIAGMPFPLLGHNRDIAYGLTMFENDDIDFYYEELNPEKTKYKTENGWDDLQKVSKIIKVKDADDVLFEFHKTRHGALVNEVYNTIDTERPVSMSWVYTQAEGKVLDALYGISRATDLNTFKTALPNIHAPGLNIMYGDAKGNVGWFATAKLYNMPDSTSTKFILDGTTGKDEHLNFYDFSQNPQAVNPETNYVYSANNQPDSINGKYYPGYYLPENRAKRITELLDAKSDWDIQTASEMLNDVTSAVNPSIIKNLETAVDAKQLSEAETVVLDKLSNWDANYTLKNTDGALFHRWLFLVMKKSLFDELGEAQFSQLILTHFFKRMIAPYIANDTSVWWDDINTSDIKESRETIVTTAFKEAYASLVKDFGDDASQWTWDKVHTIEHGHPLGQVEALQEYFNVGPFPINGTREVINNLGFNYSNEGFFKVKSGPSTRRLIDFSDVENSLSILPTGQSGNLLSPHYQDQAEMYTKGEFRKMMLNKAEIQSTSKSLLTFKPTE
ncbi:penicillin acylase family protein [Aurantibacter sp.]|uniref:penicillin acylase family protein n=1 Tax=Aurantibacter sp. TaxID=2807103 RepID=UPI00326694E3